MKIMVVEDDPASLENALAAIKYFFGETPEIVIAKTVAEYHEITSRHDYERESFNLVLTDMHIPVGKGRWDVCHKFPEKLVPAGIIILITFIASPVLSDEDVEQHKSYGVPISTPGSIPCLMVTDANGHDDPLGLLLGGSLNHALYGNPVKIVTCPEKCKNGGKDWQRYLEHFLDKNKILKEFRIDL